MERVYKSVFIKMHGCVTLVLILLLVMMYIDDAKGSLPCNAVVTKGYELFAQREENMGAETLVECCRKCKLKKARLMFWNIGDINAHTATCYCRYGVLYQLKPWGDKVSSILQHNKFAPDTIIKDAEENDIDVYDFFDHVLGNDTNEIYAFESPSNINHKSQSIHMDFTATDAALLREEKSDWFSKRHTSVITKVEQQKTWSERYGFKLKVFGFNYQRKAEHIWFAMVRSNDEYFNFHAERLNVTKADSYTCDVDTFEVNTWVRKRKLKGVAIMKFKEDCNTDLPNVTFAITKEVGLSIENIREGNGSIPISRKWSSESTVFVQYETFYALQELNFTFDAVVKNDAKVFHGSKKLNIIFNVYVADKIFTKIITSILSDDKSAKKGFTIASTYGACFNQLVKFPYIYVGAAGYTRLKFFSKNCLKFKLNNRLMKSDSATCVDSDTTSSFLTSCDNPIYSKLLWSGNTFKVNGTYTGTTAREIKSGFPSATEYKRKYENDFGISKKEPTKPSSSDVIFIIKLETTSYILCTQTKKRTDIKCLRFFVGKSFSYLHSRFSSLLAYHPASKTIYGKDNKYHIISHKEDKEKVPKTISLKRWKHIEAKYNGSLLYALQISRTDLVNSSVVIDSKTSVTYIGLNENSQHVLTWPTDSECVKNIGTTEESAYKNCNEMKRFCPKAVSREYWITISYGSTTNGKVYCDMETGDGGWMLLGDYTAHNKKPLTTSGLPSLAAANIFEVVSSNYTKIMSGHYPSLISLEGHTGTFIQFRFFCTTADFRKTIHFETNQNVQGNGFIDWVLYRAQYAPSACNRYKLYDDDNSELMGDCSAFVNQYYKNNALVFDPFYKAGFYFSLLDHACDTKKQTANDVLQYGTWKMYVRNL